MLSWVDERVEDCNDEYYIIINELDEYVDCEFFFLCLLDGRMFDVVNLC